MIKRLLITASLMLSMTQPALSVEPDEMLDDPVLEARARAISKKVRCVVCQNEDIDSSNSGVARDLRILLRERLVAGESDQEVLDFLVARYGDFVLLSPPWKPITYALWLAPAGLGLFGGGAVVYVLVGARRRKPPKGQLSDADEAEIADIVKRNTMDI